MGAPKNNNLTPRDLHVAACAWRCFKTEPTIDFGKLAEQAGFKNAASASACWGSVKKKLLAQGKAGGQPSTATASPATSKTASTRKRKTTSTPKPSEETPSKKGKTTHSTTIEEDEEYGDVGPLKKEEPKDEDDDDTFADGSDTFAEGYDRKDSFFA